VCRASHGNTGVKVRALGIEGVKERVVLDHGPRLLVTDEGAAVVLVLVLRECAVPCLVCMYEQENTLKRGGVVHGAP
jgi:hypothetical protein